MATLLEYKCPCCGGKIEFDSSLQKMKCPFCDTEFELETLKEYDKVLQPKPDEMEWETKAVGDWQQGEEESMRVYSCNSCGGEIIADSTTAATHCPFCDNPVIMTKQLSGDLKPDYIIPFKLDKTVAKSEFCRHLQNKRLLPKAFKSENHIDEIKGVYVPFWLFDADVEADMVYDATTETSHSDSNYIYYYTNHFSAVRSGKLSFEHIPVDGSEKMPDDLMESIEPYDFSQALDFQTAYLSGYVADRYDVKAEDSINRANDRVRNSTKEAFDNTVSSYHTSRLINSNIRLSNGNAKYALYPVWLLNTTWNGNKYVFAMNGQTGKFVGNLPLDKKAYHRFFAMFGAMFSVIIGLISFLIWFF